MKKLKLKTKVGNIVIFILVLFLAFPIVLYMVGSTLMKTNGELFGKEKKYYGTAIMEIYVNMPKLIPTTGENYFNIGKSYYNVITSKYKYGDGMYTFGTLGNKVMLEKAIVNFEKGINLGEGSKFYYQNLSYLINSYIADGREEEGLKLINEASKSSDKNIRDVGVLNKIVYLVKNGNVEDGIRLCEKNLEEVDYQILYVNLLRRYGKYEDYNNALEKFVEENTDGSYYYYDYYDYYEVSLLKYVDYNVAYNYEKRKDGDKVINGRITKNGEGVPYIEVTLSSEIDSRTVYTDKDGYYKVNYLPENKYSVSLKATAYILDGAYLISANGKPENMYRTAIDIGKGNEGKQDFEIREYLSLGKDKNIVYEEGSNLVFDVPKVKGTKKVIIHTIQGGSGINYERDIKNEGDFKVNMPLVNGAPALNSFTYVWSENGGNEGYLGIYSKEESEWGISFQYLDENGEIIENTVPGELRYKYKRGKLNDGEKLILDGKIDEAIKWNEEQLSIKGDSREFLYPLLKYYGQDRFTDNKKRDIEKFNEYYKRLEALGMESLEENLFKRWANVVED